MHEEAFSFQGAIRRRKRNADLEAGFSARS
jgi:hypothetical protein